MSYVKHHFMCLLAICIEDMIFKVTLNGLEMPMTVSFYLLVGQ